MAHIVDIIRLRALAQDAGSTGGWFVDLDTVWLKRPSSITTISGHIFGSQPAKPRTSGDRKFFKTAYVRSPSVREYLSPPFHFPAKSVLLPAALEFAQSLLTHPAPSMLDYNVIMDDIKNKMIGLGFRVDVQAAGRFCPVPNWIPWTAVACQEWQAFTSFGVPILSAEALLEQAVCINFPSCTSRAAGKPTHGAALWDMPFWSTGSLLHHLINAVGSAINLPPELLASAGATSEPGRRLRTKQPRLRRLPVFRAAQVGHHWGAWVTQYVGWLLC